jgi:hypothetical protein
MADELEAFQRHWLLIKIGRAFAEMDEATERGDYETAHRLCLVAGKLLKDAAALDEGAASSGDYPKSA